MENVDMSSNLNVSDNSENCGSVCRPTSTSGHGATTAIVAPISVDMFHGKTVPPTTPLLSADSPGLSQASLPRESADIRNRQIRFPGEPQTKKKCI